MSEFLTVEDVRMHSDGVFEMVLDRGDIDFTPGDCLALFAGDEKTSRPYSLASGNQDAQLRFVIRRMAGGIVSTFLSERKPGDSVKISPPFGWFRPGPPDDGSPFIFLATGTGISPFLSHFRSCPQSPPSMCLFGVRTLADAVGLERLEEQCDLRLAVSRELATGYHHGRITDLLDEMPCAAENHYYLCGLDAMIDDVSRWLEARQVPITHIHRECFFNASYAVPT
jgi:ferredoxin-NADP reductase